MSVKPLVDKSCDHEGHKKGESCAVVWMREEVVKLLVLQKNCSEAGVAEMLGISRQAVNKIKQRLTK